MFNMNANKIHHAFRCTHIYKIIRNNSFEGNESLNDNEIIKRNMKALSGDLNIHLIPASFRENPCS